MVWNIVILVNSTGVFILPYFLVVTCIPWSKVKLFYIMIVTKVFYKNTDFVSGGIMYGNQERQIHI